MVAVAGPYAVALRLAKCRAYSLFALLAGFWPIFFGVITFFSGVLIYYVLNSRYLWEGALFCCIPLRSGAAYFAYFFAGFYAGALADAGL